MRFFKTTMVAALWLAQGLLTPVSAEPAEYVLATGSTGGTYYPVGVALATLIKVKLQPDDGIGMSALTTAGSGENIRLLHDGQAQFAILQALYGQDAATGSGTMQEAGPQTALRSVAILWPNVEHFVVATADAKTGTMADLLALAGQPMALGAPESGTRGSTQALLDGLGVKTDAGLSDADYGAAVAALEAGEVKAISLPGGDPVGALAELFASEREAYRLLSFTADEAKTADAGRGLWSAYTIPADTYAGQGKELSTIAQPNFLAVNADVSEDNVYRITRAIFENLPFLQAIHPATQALAVDKALAGLPLPLHPGAARYYREIGIEIPDALIAQ
ncbi:TAXI family TRAP transporter solute-binding subunit [Loktanella sp. M215]|uniref:TAXI family TRAP transporter solute-binding subunit n=1 Tax=Loktanella sp. M215 TaxID=2675431 RepID=UPI001F2BF53E|nr:TAXI family TRAP transporter solute-binding subunit [Loktanella sp. M215]MCF7698417.1 TAXI family TRAP transporter solute-binding subunit [Loktanella sp. M215]